MLAVLSLAEGFVSAVPTSIIISKSLAAKISEYFSIVALSAVCFLWVITLSKLAIGSWVGNSRILVSHLLSSFIELLTL